MTNTHTHTNTHIHTHVTVTHTHTHSPLLSYWPPTWGCCSWRGPRVLVRWPDPWKVPSRFQPWSSSLRRSPAPRLGWSSGQWSPHWAEPDWTTSGPLERWRGETSASDHTHFHAHITSQQTHSAKDVKVLRTKSWKHISHQTYRLKFLRINQDGIRFLAHKNIESIHKSLVLLFKAT